VGGAVALKPPLKTGREGHGNRVVFEKPTSVFVKTDRFPFFTIFTTFCTLMNFVVSFVWNFLILF
jgi:hypothetical protein